MTTSELKKRREIEFRGLTKEDKWVSGCYVDIEDDEYGYIYDKKENKTEVLKHTVGQFVGTSERGVRGAYDDATKVYIGDIVECVAEADYIDDSGIKHIAKDNNGQTCLADAKKYNVGLPITFGGWESIKIIGNRHQNPELLKIK